MKRLLFLFLICSGSVFAQIGYETLKDIAYYPDAKDAYVKQRCKLDVYYPKNQQSFATILWFHGGGLTGGEKFIPESLTNKGYAVIGVNYRLSPKVKVSDILEDTAAAIAWTFNNITKYGGDTQKIFISGHSAGGYLVAMVGLEKKWLTKYNIDADKIAGIIPFSGQMITHFTVRQQSNIPEKQPVIDGFAPLSHVRADAPPLLLITGDRELEMLGRYEENAYMARMMKLVGHKQTQLFELQGYGHNMDYPAYPLLLKEVERILKSKS